MAKSTVTLGGDVEAAALLFRERGGEGGAVYVVEPPGAETPLPEFWEKYGQGARRTVGLNLDGTESRFFLASVADCFDPPVCIVRADNEEDAEGWFINELDWVQIGEDALADYEIRDSKGRVVGESNYVRYNDNGDPCDVGSIVIRRLALTGIVLPQG